MLTPEPWMIDALANGPAVAFPFAAIAGAVAPSLIGGLFGKSENKDNRKDVKKANKKAMKENRRVNAQNRRYQVADRANERAYAAKLTGQDREYARRLTAEERRYAEGLTKDDRNYARRQTAEDRRYARDLTLDDRRYADRLSKQDRANYLADKASDLSVFRKDRRRMQRVADLKAEARAESRGLDFKQLVADAQAAGFNPLTALGFAQSYSREVDYHEVGAPYQSMSQTPTSASAGGSQAAATTSAGPSRQGNSFQGGTTAAAAIPSAVMSPGTGYTQSLPPRFSSSEFIADALGAGVDTYFNAVNAQSEADERRYQIIANKVQTSLLDRQIANATPRDFGFSLTKVRPYRPSLSISDGSGLDPFHNRPTDVSPVMNIPTTGIYDFGGGSSVRGLSQDVEWSEVAQMGNELWLGANYLRDQPSVARGREWLQQRLRPGHRAPVPPGSRSYILTGRRPAGAIYETPSYGGI